MLVKIISCFFIFAVLVKADKKNDEQIIQEILNDVLKEVGKKNEIVKFLNSTFDESDEDSCSAERIYVEAQMGDGAKKRLSYELNGYLREIHTKSTQELPEFTGIYRKELRKFTYDVAPLLEELAEEMDDFSEKIFIKVITIKRQVAVKEDIRRLGNYSNMCPYGLDLKHSLLAIVTLAKVHAMTAVLNERGKLDFTNVKENFDLNVLNQTKTPQGLEEAGNSLVKSVALAWGDGWNDVVERLKTKLEESASLLYEMIKISEDFPLKVLNLADFEKGYFKYGVSDVYTSKDPIAFKIDNNFIASFIGYPIFDLNSFFGSAPNITVMLHYQDHLLKNYHDALTRYLKQYQYKKEIPSLEVFRNELKKTEWIKLFVSITELPYRYYSSSDDGDVKKYKSEAAKVNKKIWSREEAFFGKRFIETMKQLLRKAIENNVI